LRKTGEKRKASLGQTDGSKTAQNTGGVSKVPGRDPYRESYRVFAETGTGEPDDTEMVPSGAGRG